MRSRLAERLLVKTMEWSPEEISRERPLLQALASFKYNEYQQFSPGIRFIENLVKWLSQFEIVNERRIAYEFVKNQLVFFSNDQITHLVNITYTDKIHPVIMDKAAKEIGINPYWISRTFRSTHYKIILRRSLFIGLSDGARIDQLRRSYAAINNEQVLSTYSIGEEKVQDMLTELYKTTRDKKFNTVFLVDDFTASGTSYFRKKDDGSWTGKIYKFLNSIGDSSFELSKLRQDRETLDVHICFYIATEEALQALNENITQYKSENPNFDFDFSIGAIQILRSDLKQKILDNTSFVELMKKYFDPSIVDSHYSKGKHDEPYLGFNECCLPLTLNHNTPNNSVPILWFSEDKKYIGLFPRVTRHKDE